MPSPEVFAAFAVASLALLIVPGPSVLYIVTRSIDQGRSAGPRVGPRDPHRLRGARRGGRARCVGDPRVLRGGVRGREVRRRGVPDLARGPDAPRPARGATSGDGSANGPSGVSTRRASWSTS